MRKGFAAALLAAACSACLAAADEAGKKPAASDDANKLAMSDDNSPWAGYVTLGVGLVPRYDGSSTYQILPYAEGRLNYGNYYAWYEGNALKLNIIDDENIHFGPYIGIRRGRGNVTGPVRFMHDLDNAITAGAFVEWEHVAEDPRSGEFVTLSADDAVYGERGTGWSSTLRADLYRPLEFVDPGLIFSVEGDVTWGSRNYVRTYYGVSPADSAASGLPVFEAGSGVTVVGIALSLDQFLSRHFGVGLRSHYGRLLGDAGESPVSTIAGTPNQYFAGFVVNYVL
jgi:outer membrane scaffolding protein for murein synthesis (MipA/OmpV family)